MDGSNRRGYHYVFTGRVQGVGFRALCANAARDRSLVGWVRNRADGRVEAVVQGNEELLADFEEAIRQGNGWSKVKTFERHSVAIDELLVDFEVRS
ncbi:MAG: acylphosphatase [Spirochaetales bacterium]|nr:acylphosphatase [Spirochaetales bacterium]